MVTTRDIVAFGLGGSLAFMMTTPFNGLNRQGRYDKAYEKAFTNIRAQQPQQFEIARCAMKSFFAQQEQDGTLSDGDFLVAMDLQAGGQNVLINSEGISAYKKGPMRIGYIHRQFIDNKQSVKIPADIADSCRDSVLEQMNIEADAKARTMAAYEMFKDYKPTHPGYESSVKTTQLDR